MRLGVFIVFYDVLACFCVCFCGISTIIRDLILQPWFVVKIPSNQGYQALASWAGHAATVIQLFFSETKSYNAVTPLDVCLQHLPMTFGG